MHSDLISYISRLELMAFFAGYPLVYSLLYFFAGDKSQKSSSFMKKLIALLPFAYALVGTLYIGLVLKNMYPDYSMKNAVAQFENQYLKIWGMLSVLFWIPALSKRTVFSLLHSLVFFSLLLKDIFLQGISSEGNNIIRNDMNIYTISLILNAATLAAMTILYFILSAAKKKFSEG